jgi:hypothetical protein
MSTLYDTYNKINHKIYDINKKYITIFSDDFKKYKNELVASMPNITHYKQLCETEMSSSEVFQPYEEFKNESMYNFYKNKTLDQIKYYINSLDNFYLYTVSSKYNTILYNDYSENNLNDVETYYKDFQLEVTCNTNLHDACKQMITYYIEQIIKTHKHYSNKLELSANIEQKEENNENIEDKDNENVEEKVEDNIEEDDDNIEEDDDNIEEDDDNIEEDDENVEEDDENTEEDENFEDDFDEERERLYRYNENFRLKIVLFFSLIIFIYMHLFLKVTFQNVEIEEL